MIAFSVYFGNMNFAFLKCKGILLKRKTAINFGGKMHFLYSRKMKYEAKCNMIRKRTFHGLFECF